MDARVTLVGLELIVADLDSALRLFQGALGLELVERRQSEDPVGEVAVLAVGDAAITLLAPAASGPGVVLDKREPRLAQMFLAVAPGGLASLAEQITASGASVHVLDEHRCFVPPSVVDGATGVNTAVTLIELDSTWSDTLAED